MVWKPVLGAISVVLVAPTVWPEPWNWQNRAPDYRISTL
jgi:hypothetical protein